MNRPRIRILTEYYPYLALLSGYNFDQIGYFNHGIRYTIGATIHILLIFNFAISVSWRVVEDDIDFKKIVVALPLVISIMRMGITFIALMLKSRMIRETIDQLQCVVDQRKLPLFL